LANSLIDPKGLFNIYRCDRCCDFPSGGVCILVHRTLDSLSVDIDYTLFPNVEIVACHVFNCSRKFLLICSYIAPSLIISDFITSIDCLRVLCNTSVDCIVAADFNLPNFNWANFDVPRDSKSVVFYNFICDLGLTQLITEPTRKSKILDLLLTNNPLFVHFWEVAPSFSTSDHDSINFSLLFSINKQPPVSQSYKFLWSQADWDAFADHCRCIDWQELFDVSTCPEICWSLFLDFIYFAASLFVPSKISRITVKCHHSKNIKRLMSKKLTIWTKCRHDPSIENNQKYKTVGNQVHSFY